jgi:WD40 repeat protein
MREGSSSAVTLNPFPGLRPFQEDEDYLFFGREHQVDTMVDILAKRKFLAVVGTSGSGKSSLVNCGLEPALHQGLMASAGASWRIVKFRPGDRPIKAMARAMAAEGVLFRNFVEHGLSLFEVVDSTLRMSTVGLLDIVEQASLNDTFHLLVVVDQFEELFRYRQLDTGAPIAAEGFSEEATAFVSLLLEVLEKPQHQIHIVLTMRSDFLGDCTKFPGLAEAINSSLYLVPRMTRDERRDAITNPVLVAGATITPVLVTRLVNDVGDNPDQLSILQHALNRTWARWKEEGGIGPVDLPHYEAIGTMAEALDRHAEEAYGELAKPGEAGEDSPLQKLCRRTFQALTDKASDGRGIRRPTKWNTLREITMASEPQLLRVIEVFREPSRSFLMPPTGTPLEEESVIDISHESLMRVWRRLSSWGDEEARWADEYRRLAETAIRHHEGSESLLRDPALQIALNWWQASNPNEAWARRYHPGFQAAKVFLNQSAEARSEEQEAERRAVAQRRKKERSALIGSFLISLAALLSAGYMWFQSDQANRQVARTWSAVAAGLMKEHQVDPESSIKFAVAALNSPLGSDPSESVKLIANLLNAIELYGEQSASQGETSTNPVPIWSLALIGGNQLVSAGEKGSFRIWNLNLGHPRRLVPANLDNPVFLRLTNGNIIAAGSLAKDIGNSADGKQGTVRLQLWNPDLTRKIADKAAKLDGIFLIKQLPRTGDLLIVDSMGKPSLWKQDLSRIPSSLNFNDRIKSLAVLKPRGEILAYVLDNSQTHRLQLWSSDLLAKLQDIRLGSNNTDAIDSLLQLDNQRIVTGGSDGTLQLWSTALTRIGPRIEAQPRQILSLAQLANGEVLSGSSDGTLRRWRASMDGLTALHLPFPADQPQILTLLAVNSTLISGGSDGSLKRWQWEKGLSSNHSSRVEQEGYEVVMVTPHGGGEIYRLRSTNPPSNDKELEFGPAGENAGKLRRTRLVGAGNTTILSLLLLKDGDLATGDFDGSLQRWTFNGKDWVRKGDVYRPASAAKVRGMPNSIWSMTELRNGDVVLGMDRGQVRRLRFKGGEWLEQGKLCKPLATNNAPATVLGGRIFSLVTLTDGDLVSGSKNGTIVRWHQPDQQWCKSPSIIPGGDEPEIFSMTELSDGTMLSSTGSGGLTLWKWGKNLTTKAELENIYFKGSSLISSVAALPKSQGLVLLADFQGNFKAYPGQKKAIALGCSALGEKLQQKQLVRSLKPYEKHARKACQALEITRPGLLTR